MMARISNDKKLSATILKDTRELIIKSFKYRYKLTMGEQV